jgi:hypothetical protein
MDKLMTLFIVEDEISSEDSWRLLEWCHRVGAEEFSLEILERQDEGEERARAIDQALAVFEREPAPREGVMARQGEAWVRAIPLWVLTPASIRQLQQLLPDGLFTYGVWTEPAWCENLRLYRNGAPMLGIVTHESMGTLHVTPSEREALEEMDIRYHLELPFYVRTDETDDHA